MPAAARPLQGRSGNEVEAVEVDAVGRDVGDDPQVLAPDGLGLAGQAEQEVDDDRRAVAVAQRLDEGDRLVAAGAATLPAAHGGVEALDADGDAVGAGLEAGVDLLGVEMDDAPLDGDLAARGERQAAADGADQPRQLGGRQRARCAAAEIDGVDGLRPYGAGVGLALDLGDHQVGVGGRGGRRVGVAVEAAEQAVIGAEGDVDVGEARTGAAVSVDKPLPGRLDLLGRQRPPAAPRHDGAAGRKGVADGIPAEIGKVRHQAFRRHHLTLTPLVRLARGSAAPAPGCVRRPPRLIKTLGWPGSLRYAK